MSRDRNDQDRKVPWPKRLRPNGPDRIGQTEKSCAHMRQSVAKATVHGERETILYIVNLRFSTYSLVMQSFQRILWYDVSYWRHLVFPLRWLLYLPLGKLIWWCDTIFKHEVTVNNATWVDTLLYSHHCSAKNTFYVGHTSAYNAVSAGSSSALGQV